MDCEFARHYEQANGKPLTCDNCPKENTRRCEKEVEHGDYKQRKVGNGVHPAMAAVDRPGDHRKRTPQAERSVERG